MSIQFITHEAYRCKQFFSETIYPALEKTATAVYHFAKDFFILYAKRVLGSVYYFVIYKIPFVMTLCNYAFESIFTYLLLPSKSLSPEELKEGTQKNITIIDRVFKEENLMKKILLLGGIVTKVTSQVFFDSSEDMNTIWINWAKMLVATMLSLLCLNLIMNVWIYFIVISLLFYAYMLLLIASLYMIQNVSYFEPIKNYNSLAGIQQLEEDCTNYFFPATTS